MATGKTLASVSTAYSTLQAGDIMFWERAGTAGKTTFTELASEIMAENTPYGVQSENTSATLGTDIAAKLVTVDATAGDVTHGLPAAADMDELPMVAFYRPDSSGNAVSLDGNGSETILGQAVYSLAPGQLLFLWSDGSNYHGIERLPGRVDSGEITSSTSELVFALPSTFREIKFEWHNAEMSVASQALVLQVGTGTTGSPTWITSYPDVYLEASSGAVSSALATVTSCPISTGVLSGYPSAGQTRISGFNDTGAFIQSSAGGVATGPTQRVLERHQRVDNGGPLTVARVFASSGSIDALNWTLEGVV